MDLDVLIFGGGGAGLWLLDELRRRGFAVLLADSAALGAGQTVSAQGIIHGGIKYTLTGMLTESARAIREMPALWRDCLAGRREPHLTHTVVSAEYCHLWRTGSLISKLGMIGARAGLRSGASRVEKQDRPAALASCPGDVFRVDEPVIDAPSFLADLAQRHRDQLLKIDANQGLEFVTSGPGAVSSVKLRDPESGAVLDLRPRHVVLTAGAGNAALRESIGLSPDTMQRRPLHMVMVRGRLPELFGHCVDGAKTRVTITSSRDSQSRVVWQVGGQVSEDGVAMEETDLLAHARDEVRAVLPDVDLTDTEWAAYRVDRAEGKTTGGVRPAGVQIRAEGNVITAWPTKLVLVPELAKLIAERLETGQSQSAHETAAPEDWPRPAVAPPPWEANDEWQRPA